jgi:hypothetical protein
VTHSDVKEFKCDKCGYECNKKGNLDSHERQVHENHRPYVCGIDGCKEAFKTKPALEKHRQRKHSDERPFKCGICGGSFKTNADLDSHRRQVHENDRRYACSFCNKPFCTKQNLCAHERTHTNEKPFVCPHKGCGERFKLPHHLKYHINSWHTPEGQQRKKKQEERVARALTAAKIPFKREHHIDFTCLDDVGRDFARIDFVLTLRTAVVFLEVDEGQHKSGMGAAGCDTPRMMAISRALALEGNTLPIIQVRYNPDAFRVDGKQVKLTKTKRETRLIELLTSEDSVLRAQETLDRPLSVLYMYFDARTDEDGNVQPIVVTDDAGFNDLLNECVLPTIVDA